MFASDTKRDVPVGDVTVTVRKLSGRSLEKASEAQSISAATVTRSFGPEVMKVLREGRAEQTPEQRTASRYQAYDRQSVLVAGIMRWTSPVPLAQGIDDLDEESAELLFRAILDLSLPAIDPEAVKAAEKKA